jgi:hypothetical protein
LPWGSKVLAVMKKMGLRPVAYCRSSVRRCSSKVRAANQLVTRRVVASRTPGSWKRATKRLPPMSPQVAVSKYPSPS